MNQLIPWFICHDWFHITGRSEFDSRCSILFLSRSVIFVFLNFCIQNQFKKYLQFNHSSIPTLFSLTSFLLSHSLPHLPSIACICNWPSKHLPFFSIISLWIDLCSNSNFLYRRNHISKSILSYHSCFIMKFLFFCFIASLIIASHAEESVDVVLGLVGRVIGAVFSQSHSSADPSP